jgi:hypothetical protein
MNENIAVAVLRFVVYSRHVVVLELLIRCSRSVYVRFVHSQGQHLYLMDPTSTRKSCPGVYDDNICNVKKEFKVYLSETQLANHSGF